MDVVATEYRTNGAASIVPQHIIPQQRVLEFAGKGRSHRVSYNISKSAMEQRTRCPGCRGELGLTRKRGIEEDFVCKQCKTRYKLNIVTGELKKD